MKRKDELLAIFKEMWEEISSNFAPGTKRKIKNEVLETLKNSNGLSKFSTKKKGFVAGILYSIQEKVYSEKGLKPKNLKEIAEMTNISVPTISRNSI